MIGIVAVAEVRNVCKVLHLRDIAERIGDVLCFLVNGRRPVCVAFCSAAET